MLRLGVSLPALMQLLGHTDIRMTLRYDLTIRAGHSAGFTTRVPHRQPYAVRPHQMPVLSVPNCPSTADPLGIRQAIAATRHLLEMYRRGLPDERTRRRLQRLDQRLLEIALQLDHIVTPEK